MRGNDTVRGSLFSYVDLEKRIRADHPLRVIRGIVNATLAALSGEFEITSVKVVGIWGRSSCLLVRQLW